MSLPGMTMVVTQPPATGPLFTGGTEVDSGGFRIHTFTSSGTLTMVRPGEVEYLVVGGGGGGGRRASDHRGGGGGAGRFITATGLNITASQTITIGGGGAGGTSSGTSGSDGVASSIGSLVSAPGGGGGGAADGAPNWSANRKRRRLGRRRRFTRRYSRCGWRKCGRGNA